MMPTKSLVLQRLRYACTERTLFLFLGHGSKFRRWPISLCPSRFTHDLYILVMLFCSNPHRQRIDTHTTSRGGRMSKSINLLFWEIRKSEGRGFVSRPRIFESWLSQTNDFKVDTCCSLVWHLALLG